MIFYDRLHVRRTIFLVAAGTGALLGIGILSGILLSIIRHGPLPPETVRLAMPANPKQVAITFDDGPDPVYTRAIMEFLKKEGVPATFFVIGTQVIRHQDVLKELNANGFEIGNHTFTHSHDVHSSPWRLTLELQATRRIVEYAIGRTPRLYRPPFLLDIERSSVPRTPQGKNIARIAEEYGYITVGAGVDPRDWDGAPAATIVERVKKYLPSPDGNIILFHDDKIHNAQETLAALHMLVPMLKREGYEFVPLSAMVGLDRAAALPPVYSMSLTELLSTFSIGAAANLGFAMYWILSLMLILGGARMSLLLILWTYSRIKRSANDYPGYPEALLPVSVVVPAYNEAENIAATLQSILKNTFLPREIIVINDASTDETGERIERMRMWYPDLIRPITFTENRGKAAALNIGFLLAQSPVVVTLDGDTILDYRALYNLARHFTDPRVAGVAGEVHIANPRTMLGKFQEIEYTLAQRIEKEALGAIGIVGIVPGAIGAWRKSAVLAAGGYQQNTLTEDQDLTLALLRSGLGVLYEREALAYTEAPHTLRAFLRQRFRWTLGTMQCLWKHRGILRQKSCGKLKLLLLPNNALYGAVLPILYPLADAYALFLIATGSFSVLLASYLIFIAIDFMYAILGLAQVRWGLRLLPLLPLQRLYYRALFFAATESWVKAVSGTLARWSRSERRGDALQELPRVALGLSMAQEELASGNVVIDGEPSTAAW